MVKIGIKMKNLKEILARVTKTKDCWVWDGGKHKLGYGVIKYNGKTEYAHRVVYSLLVGEIPKGKSLDHLCRNPSCVNPKHLEPVTHRENVLRGVGPTAVNKAKTHCKRGHEFTEENTRWGNFNGASRFCRACDKVYKYKWQKAKTAEYHAMGLNSKGKPFATKGATL